MIQAVIEKPLMENSTARSVSSSIAGPSVKYTAERAAWMLRGNQTHHRALSYSHDLAV